MIPLLPAKNFLTKFNAETARFSGDRQISLEFFLSKLLRHEVLCLSNELRLFVCAANEVRRNDSFIHA